MVRAGRERESQVSEFRGLGGDLVEIRHTLRQIVNVTGE
jgi:hypothetical protein